MGTSSSEHGKLSLMDRFINGMERAMRFIPSPVKIFLWLILFISLLALIISLTAGTITNPADGSEITIQNPISKEGVQWLLNSFISNITGYMAFGTVLVMMLGVGTCEQSGMMGTLMRTVTHSATDKLIPLVICLIGVMGNAMGNSSIFVLTPLAGFAYLAIGRSPLWGMVTAYIANISGMSANFIFSETDVLSTGITNSVLESAGIAVELQVTSNWYFMSASAVVMTLTSYFISERVINKAFAPPSETLMKEIGADTHAVTAEEKGALKRAGIALLGFIAVILVGIFTGVLQDEEGSIAPFLENLPVVFFFAFLLLAVVYGRSVNKITSINDVVKMMMVSVQKMSRYIVLVVVISQFTALLNWTQLTRALAAVGAEFLEKSNMSGVGIILLFILLCCVVNLFITSMSAMYNIFAPVAVPIFTHLGYHPALTQAAFRIADSCTNVMSPVSPFLYMMLDMARDTFKADEKDCSVAKWMSCLIPASLIMSVVWIALLLIWMALDLPLGPGAPVFMQ